MCIPLGELFRTQTVSLLVKCCWCRCCRRHRQGYTAFVMQTKYNKKIANTSTSTSLSILRFFGGEMQIKISNRNKENSFNRKTARSFTWHCFNACCSRAATTAVLRYIAVVCSLNIILSFIASSIGVLPLSCLKTKSFRQCAHRFDKFPFFFSFLYHFKLTTFQSKIFLASTTQFFSDWMSRSRGFLLFCFKVFHSFV